MEKVFDDFVWKDDKSGDTPLNAENLNKINGAVNVIDGRVVELDRTKAKKIEVSSAISDHNASTAAHPDKVSKSGDIVDGEIAFLGGTNVVRRFGESGVNGFVKVATIKVVNRYINHTIEFDIAGRGRKSATRLYILFDNVNNYDPNVYSFLKEGDCTYLIYLSKSDTATWDLLVQKNEPYGSIAIFNFHCAGVQGNIEVTYPSNTLLTSVPENSIPATAIEYALNSKTKAGIVPAGNNQINKVYAIDADGNPKWRNCENIVTSKSYVITMLNSNLTLNENTYLSYYNIADSVILKGCVNIMVNSAVGDGQVPFIGLFKFNKLALEHDFNINGIIVPATVVQGLYNKPETYNVSFGAVSDNDVTCSIYGITTIPKDSRVVFNFAFYLPIKNGAGE